MNLHDLLVITINFLCLHQCIGANELFLKDNGPEPQYQLGSDCNLLDSCHQESLICFDSQCHCAPGYKNDNNKTCTKFQCSDDNDCKTYSDEFRRCDKKSKNCTVCDRGMLYHKKRQRCVSMLGQPCGQEKTMDGIMEDDIWNMNNTLVCRNGVYVCRPNHYPDPYWRFCKREPEECRSHDQCQMFSDYYRFCQINSAFSPNRSFCFCGKHSKENIQTLQCLHANPMVFNYLMMPFFLLPMCLMIVIVAYVGHRLFRSNNQQQQNHNSHHHHHHHHPNRGNHINRYHCSGPSTSTRRGRQAAQPDRSKSPSAFTDIDLNDCPPSYEVVLREQQRIQDELAREHSSKRLQQSEPSNIIDLLALSPSSSSSSPSTSSSTGRPNEVELEVEQLPFSNDKILVS